MLRTLRFVLAFATLAVCVSAAQAATITVTNDSTVSPGSGTCTLAQAIAASNAANGINAAWIGSAATTGNCATADASPSLNTIVFATNVQATQVFTATDNWWYGPNALPPIASVIAIDGGTTGVTLVASHIGDPTPATANAFRFFYVSGGLSGELPAGTLVLRNLSLSGGVAKGGEGGAGGGGAGMGGAIFNQGSLQLVGVTLTANSANGGGSNGTGTGGGGGGMGADPTGGGGGFGGSLGGMYGGAGGTGAASGGAGGGGGFLGTAAGASAGNSNGATGGGLGALGGYGGGFSGSYGDGGGGGNG
ncbi:MAG: hypothetical protein KGH80_10350, partial [Xanthomonadaceae bacterium]|nr:hypothetical protein [Xanthomonadaceae bacterium]